MGRQRLQVVQLLDGAVAGQWPISRSAMSLWSGTEMSTIRRAQASSLGAIAMIVAGKIVHRRDRRVTRVIGVSAHALLCVYMLELRN